MTKLSNNYSDLTTVINSLNTMPSAVIQRELTVRRLNLERMLKAQEARAMTHKGVNHMSSGQGYAQMS
jgi:hypothetical protein